MAQGEVDYSAQGPATEAPSLLDARGIFIAAAFHKTIKAKDLPFKGSLSSPYGMGSFIGKVGQAGGKKGALNAFAGGMLYTGNPYIAAGMGFVGHQGGLANFGPLKDSSFIGSFSGKQGAQMLPTPGKLNFSGVSYDKMAARRSQFSELSKIKRHLSSAPMGELGMEHVMGSDQWQKHYANRIDPDRFLKRSSKIVRERASEFRVQRAAKDLGIDLNKSSMKSVYTQLKQAGDAATSELAAPRAKIGQLKTGISKTKHKLGRVDLLASGYETKGRLGVDLLKQSKENRITELVMSQEDKLKAMSDIDKYKYNKYGSVADINLKTQTEDTFKRSRKYKSTSRRLNRQIDIKKQRIEDLNKSIQVGVTKERSILMAKSAVAGDLVSSDMQKLYTSESRWSMLGGKYSDYDSSDMRAIKNIKKTNRITQRAAVRKYSEQQLTAHLSDMSSRDFGKLAKQYGLSTTATRPELAAAMADKTGIVGGARKFASFASKVAVASAVVTVGKLAVQGAVATTQGATKILNELRSLEFGGPGAAVHTQGATTERQRALQALQNSTMNARQFVGAEAALLHS